MTPSEYFDFQIGRLAFAWGSTWWWIPFQDGSAFIKLAGPFYWRRKP